jgi:hypothetical protein
MNNDPQTAAYGIVLRDLRAKRSHIDQAIAAIEALTGVTPVQASSSAVDTGNGQLDSPGDYLSMSIPDAAKKLLARRRKMMGNAEIAKGLKDGGLVLTSVDPINTIGSVLTRRFHQVGDIVRVERGMWGLKEWYPNRTFARKSGESGESPKVDEIKTGDDPIVLEQPSEPPLNAPPQKSSEPEQGPQVAPVQRQRNPYDSLESEMSRLLGASQAR